MNNIYKNIQEAISNGKKLLAILIDPDKFSVENASAFVKKVNTSIATHIFVGGSVVNAGVTDGLVDEIKKHTELPIVLFPGDITQITNKADGLLFLSLLSGRNPDYLIGKHVEAVSELSKTQLDIISTGYILIESGRETAVQQVTETQPMSREDIQNIADTAVAGQLLGMKLIYLEAGSGAMEPVALNIINAVRNVLAIPLIVGGGIKNKTDLENAYDAGADIVVIGNAFENDEAFFDDLQK